MQSKTPFAGGKFQISQKFYDVTPVNFRNTSYSRADRVIIIFKWLICFHYSNALTLSWHKLEVGWMHALFVATQSPF